MSFKIYTKTGDEGSTSLFGGARLPKNHLRIEAYGTVDELNSHLGLVNDLCKTHTITDTNIPKTLFNIQNKLFVIGSNLASDPNSDFKLPTILEGDLTLLEDEIDRMELALPALTNFILPGGHPLVSECHITRCVCRRAERLTVALNTESPLDNNLIIKYLNRLSDYLFVLSRFFALQLNVAEVLWKN